MRVLDCGRMQCTCHEICHASVWAMGVGSGFLCSSPPLRGHAAQNCQRSSPILSCMSCRHRHWTPGLCSKRLLSFWSSCMPIWAVSGVRSDKGCPAGFLWLDWQHFIEFPASSFLPLHFGRFTIFVLMEGRRALQECKKKSEGSARLTHFYELDVQVKGLSDLEISLVRCRHCTCTYQTK